MGSGSGTGSGSGAGTAAKPAWPAPPAPSLPAALAGLRWPSTAEGAKAKWPALADPNQGLRADDLILHVQPLPSPISARLWMTRPGLDLRVLEDAWGPNTRDLDGDATWFAVSANLKARYPARYVSKTDGVELSYYVPVLDRIEAAPDGMVPEAGPLLGQPAEALTAYQAWNLKQGEPLKPGDPLVQLELPPGEWDNTSLAVIALVQKGKIGRVTVTVRFGKAPVDEAAIRERLRRRWGEPRAEGDATIFQGPGGVRVEVQKLNTSSLLITYEKR